MKRIIKSIILAVFALPMLSGCESFLNVDILGKNTIDGYFSSLDGFKAAGVGLHSKLLKFYDDELIKVAELQGPHININKMNIDEAAYLVYEFASEAEHNAGHPYYAWNKGYEVITNANEIIKYAPKIREISPNATKEIDRVEAYAYFVRALVLFQMTNIYGQAYDYTSDGSHLGVCYIDFVPGFDDILSRHDVKYCYEHTLEDIQKALDLFGGDELKDVTYANGLACEALFARIYLYMKDYDNAAKYAKIVMDKVPLVGRDKYIDMFRRAQECPGEGIFRLNTYDEGSAMRSTCDPTKNQDILPSKDFYNSFEENDIRKSLLWFEGEEEDSENMEMKTLAICKYLPFKHGEEKEENRRADYNVLRVSEMYLIHAEALCLGANKDLKAAADDIKALRARALGVNKEEIKLIYTGAEQLYTLIKEEREKELAFEGHIFFDYKRRGESIIRDESCEDNDRKLEYPSYRFAMPIAQLELQANDYMVQNPGYNGRKEIGE